MQSLRVPTLSDCADVLVEASNEGHVAWPGLGGHVCVGHTPGSPILYHASVMDTKGTYKYDDIDVIQQGLTNYYSSRRM